MATSKRAATAVPRKPGRPKRVDDAAYRRGRAARAAVTPLLSREHILERATELAKEEPLAELSMVGLAREFGVTPALIHYYVGSRDDLISGVVNRYFRARVERFEPPTGDWRADLENIARVSYELAVEHGGVLRYIFSHNRYRLFQKVAPGETDYGLVFFDRFARAFADGGFTPKQGALGYHLLLQFVLSCAYAEVGHQLPVEHERYVYERLVAAPRADFPGAHFLAKPFSRLDAESVFVAGLRLLLDGFASWRR